MIRVDNKSSVNYLPWLRSGLNTLKPAQKMGARNAVNVPVSLINENNKPYSLYLFCWDEIPGNDTQKFAEFLERRYGIAWAKTAKFEKNDKTITVTSTENNILLLTLDDSKTRLTLKVDGITDDFTVITENNKLNIYPYNYSNDLSTYMNKVILRGPGEVIGFSPVMIARVEPLNGENDFEPNYFPFVEFVEADFPWRYSIDNGNDKSHAIPWLALIVLKQDEFIDAPIDTAKLPVIKITGKNEKTNTGGAEKLPDLSQLWAWCHVQIAGNLDELYKLIHPGKEMPPVSSPDIFAAAVKQLMDYYPEMFCSRLMCPRRLEPYTRYIAFIVPTYEMGRCAGLGMDICKNAYSWYSKDSEGKLKDNTDLSIPVYYRWEFQTSESGDFETLINRVHKPERMYKPEDSNIIDFGVKRIDGSTPGYFTEKIGEEIKERIFSESTSSEILYEGALTYVDAENNRKSFSDISHDKFTGELKSVLNETLNTDVPNCEKDSDNDPLIAPPVSGSHFKNATTLSADTSTDWVSELNLDRRCRLPASNGTMMVKENQEEFMQECWEQVGAIKEANQLLQMADIAHLVGSNVKERHIDVLDDSRFTLITSPFHHYYSYKGSGVEKSFKTWFRESGIPRGTMSYKFRHTVNKTMGIKNLGNDKLFNYIEKPLAVEDKDFSFITEIVGKLTVTQSLKPFIEVFSPVISKNDSSLAEHQKDSEIGDFTEPKVEPVAPENVNVQREQVDKGTIYLSDKLRSLIDHKKDLLDRLNNMILGQKLDNFNSLMRSPHIDIPTYQLLLGHSLEMISPGLGSLEKNTMVVLRENRRFIESYMVGLNHEMGREMLWRGYPTDQKGTVFRYFWNSPLTTLNPQPDIKNITSWNHQLGSNGPGSDSKNNIVLGIKADFVRRYPYTIILALKVVNESSNWSSNQWTTVLDNIVNSQFDNGAYKLITKPDKTCEFIKTVSNSEDYTYKLIKTLFWANVSEDTLFIGFDTVTVKDETNKYSYYFIFMEHPSMPRFGLNESDNPQTLNSWDEISWEDVKKDENSHWIEVGEGMNSVSCRDENIKWGENSAAIAWITSQRPIRVVKKADTILRR